MDFSVLKAASYILVHTPDMVIHNGTTQTTLRQTNPNAEYLTKIKDFLRPFDKVVSYPPNQTYIGNITPEELKKIDFPWYNKDINNSSRQGKYGEIMPQDEFLGLIKICDAFDLVLLEKDFTILCKDKLTKHNLFIDQIDKIKDGEEISIIENYIKNENAEGLYNNNVLVGCVKKAHDVDPNLNAHVLLENLVVKASGVLALKNLIVKNNIDPDSIDYIIECSEEACGDMNQRGGGNFAKSIAEVAGVVNASGSDTRGFCAAPAHALISAASLVRSGTYKNVVILAGGATAKLGMNGQDHVKKDIPVLEDVLGGFAVLISQNDGVSPIINNTITGKHTVKTGASPQAVITSLVSAPLDANNLKITDIDKYSVEMQNPDITKPAGAGDVPEANYKMIAALAVMKKEIERTMINNFIEKHGMTGWAPTQGHIPSGVPYLGFAKEDLTTGNLNKIMVIGKGSLFLGRMTNQFDGVSILLERNTGKKEEFSANKEEIKSLIAEAMFDLSKHFLNS